MVGGYTWIAGPYGLIGLGISIGLVLSYLILKTQLKLPGGLKLPRRIWTFCFNIGAIAVLAVIGFGIPLSVQFALKCLDAPINSALGYIGGGVVLVTVEISGVYGIYRSTLKQAPKDA